MAWKWPFALGRKREPKSEPTIPAGHIRVRLRYVGKVQAVGFRFTVDGCAREAGVTGWVKNMDDGSVLTEAQGTPEQVVDFKRLVQEAIDNPKTWIEGYLAEEGQVPPKADTRFSILNL